MRNYLIEGGHLLHGSVEISGAKNSALGLLVATLLSNSPSTIHQIPQVSDVDHLLETMGYLGAKIEKKDHSVWIDGSQVNPETTIDYDCVKKMRASSYLLGALLGKYKKATVALPGGCDIGSRPLDQHVKGFQRLGATVTLKDGCLIAEAKELIGTNIFLDIPSVGATINLMLASVLAKGVTHLINAAKEPHIVDVANCLNSMGAKITGAGTDTIEITGVSSLHGTTYTTIPDQIEAGTFLIAGLATGGSICLENIIPSHLHIIQYKLEEFGATFESFQKQRGTQTIDCLKVTSPKHRNALQLVTAPYPGFPTDLQPQMAVLCGLSNGISVIRETIFEKRYKYVDEVNRMSGQLKVTGDSVVINGIQRYQGAVVDAPDLRAGAALTIAALNAQGKSAITNIEYIERGYEHFDEKLKQLGAKIEIVETRNMQEMIRKIKK